MNKNMNNSKKSFYLFLSGCLTLRLFIAYIAKIINIKYLPILGVIALIPAFGFIYYYFSNTRTTGPETFGEKIWWNNIRILHFICYLTFAILACCKNNYAWIALLIDVLIGLAAVLIHHLL